MCALKHLFAESFCCGNIFCYQFWSAFHPIHPIWEVQYHISFPGWFRKLRTLVTKLHLILKVPLSIQMCCCCVWQMCVWLKMPYGSNLSHATGTWLAQCGDMDMFSSFREQFLLACLTRCPVITSTLSLYFMLHSHNTLAPRSSLRSLTFPRLSELHN